ncbi:7-carboxy-7-deazaguanine synthase QueE [bacterium]|nr:7-carboxy-7-deazaguanine synthase QueE [bacterium]
MEKTANIREIFTSLQGEGPYVGVKQLFIRFCGCNLDCEYCDTEEMDNKILKFNAKHLRTYIEQFDVNTVHSISLTGGEPLLWTDFLKEFLPLTDTKIYLETNSTLPKELEKIIKYINIISADIKLPSSSKVENSFELHDDFFKTATKYNTDLFAKIVFDENITEDEIAKSAKLAKTYKFPIILQPKTVNEQLNIDYEIISKIFNKFLSYGIDVRVIPQVHKFLQAP